MAFPRSIGRAPTGPAWRNAAVRALHVRSESAFVLMTDGSGPHTFG